MEIKTSIDAGTALIEVVGKLTVQTSPDLSATIEQLPEDVSELVLELAGMDYVASAGLRVLVAADKLAVKRGGTMRLLHPTDEVMEVFEMTGLSEVFTIER